MVTAALLLPLFLVGPGAAAPTRSGQSGPDGTLPTSTTVPVDGSGAPEVATPTGAVAYVTRAGAVLVGQGTAPPRPLGSGAAVGRNGVGAVALSPDGSRVAWIGADGAVVARPVAGGPPSVLANDAVVAAVGREPVIAWNATGDQVAYVAVGTKDMVRPTRTDRKVSSEDAFPAPLPSGAPLGNVVRLVGRDGVAAGRLGDPSRRSMIGLSWSTATGLLVLQSEVPGTRRRYTLSVAAPGTTEESPTVFAADDPAFSADGRFIVAVGPAKGFQELLRVDTDSLERRTLVSSERICSPAISPDGSRVVFGAGPRCSRIQLVATEGGPVVDVTPKGLPSDAVFSSGPFGWTAEGRYLTHALCRRGGGCDGRSVFLDPDLGRLVRGPGATTVVPALQATDQKAVLDVQLDGPIRFGGQFPVDPTLQARLTDTTGADGRLETTLRSGRRRVSIKVQGREGSTFVTGQLAVTDPAAGVDRTFFVLGRANLTGVQVFSISGVWISTDDVPFASGRFTWSVRRG